MKRKTSLRWPLFLLVSVWFLCEGPCVSVAQTAASGSTEKFFALPLTEAKQPAPKVLERYGVPFQLGAIPWRQGKPAHIAVGGQVKRIFLLGMTESSGIGSWSDPRDQSVRFFVGDELGKIRVKYSDGSEQVFPLVLGESVWWGLPFYQYPEPFPSDARLRDALAGALHLYPATPVEDGRYVAVLTPRAAPIASIEVEYSPAKKGSVVVEGMTAETVGSAELAGATVLPQSNLSPEIVRFANEKSLRPEGTDVRGTERRLEELSRALYTSDEQFRKAVPTVVPDNFSGPRVTFRGTPYASILQNAFYANVQDMLAKIDPDGTYHTSTRGAVSFGGYGFGTYRNNAGLYYSASWSRDMGRALQELDELGYTEKASLSVDKDLRLARLWQEDPALKFHGHVLPPHWSRIVNRPDTGAAFENDGHGLMALSLYKLWQRLPDRDAWLRSHWTDVKAAGDWIPWQFEHPEISGAANGVLLSTGEAAGGHGNSKGHVIYPDDICMIALEALAQMADSIGETASAAVWRDRAAKMKQAIPGECLTTDAKYGRVWKLDLPGWPVQATALAPLIFVADYKGFAPEDDDAAWRPANQAAYQRLIDTYRPFGFYGQAMGYGQGFVSQAALLLDRMKDATTILDWTAKQIYDPRFGSFIVPEGVQRDPSARFWYRAGDLGNGVQEAEIVKTLRLVIGVDDTQPQRLRIFPRMPYGWKEMAVDKYPALYAQDGRTQTAHIRYTLRRAGGGMRFDLSSDKSLGPVAVRLGPFAKQPSRSAIRVNGKEPAGASTEQSGDSWWVRFVVPVGPPSA